MFSININAPETVIATSVQDNTVLYLGIVSSDVLTEYFNEKASLGNEVKFTRDIVDSNPNFEKRFVYDELTRLRDLVRRKQIKVV